MGSLVVAILEPAVLDFVHQKKVPFAYDYYYIWLPNKIPTSKGNSFLTIM